MRTFELLSIPFNATRYLLNLFFVIPPDGIVATNKKTINCYKVLHIPVIMCDGPILQCLQLPHCYPPKAVWLPTVDIYFHPHVLPRRVFSRVPCVVGAQQDRYYPGCLDIREPLLERYIQMDPSLVIKWQGTTAKLAQLLLETNINMVSDVLRYRAPSGRSTFIYNAKLNCSGDSSRGIMQPTAHRASSLRNRSAIDTR